MEQISDDTFLCVRHAEHHKMKEVGYNLPDAVFALSRPEEERERLRKLQNEDVLVLGNAHYVRGWAGMPIQKREGLWGFGFWVQISDRDFAEFERLGRVGHPKYLSRVANQGLYGAPTLGLIAEQESRGRGLRPFIRFKDDQHPLAALQKNGISEELWRKWLSDAFHEVEREAEPKASPFQATLREHGWTIYEPADLGKAPARLVSSPKIGDTVKVGIGVLAADQDGQVLQHARRESDGGG